MAEMSERAERLREAMKGEFGFIGNLTDAYYNARVQAQAAAINAELGVTEEMLEVVREVIKIEIGINGGDERKFANLDRATDALSALLEVASNG